MTYVSACPHCGVEDSAPGAFCGACGKALPTAVRSVPRVVGGGQFAATAVGQIVQGAEFRQRSKKAEGAILAVAIIQTIVGAAGIFAARGAGQSQAMLIAVGAFGVAAVFWGLYSWAQHQPLPAAIIGLVVYGTLLGLNVTFTIARMSHGAKGTGIGGLGVGWVDVLVISALVRAIAASAAHRKLLQHGEKAQTAAAPC